MNDELMDLISLERSVFYTRSFEVDRVYEAEDIFWKLDPFGRNLEEKFVVRIFSSNNVTDDTARLAWKEWQECGNHPYNDD
jgi:hypothetical protein